MRRWADRLDDDGAPRRMGFSFTFEEGVGICFRDDDRGCPMWYLGRDDYERAFTETGTGNWLGWWPKTSPPGVDT
jgi:hypothetical protein